MADIVRRIEIDFSPAEAGMRRITRSLEDFRPVADDGARSIDDLKGKLTGIQKAALQLGGSLPDSMGSTEQLRRAAAVTDATRGLPGADAAVDGSNRAARVFRGLKDSGKLARIAAGAAGGLGGVIVFFLEFILEQLLESAIEDVLSDMEGETLKSSVERLEELSAELKGIQERLNPPEGIMKLKIPPSLELAEKARAREAKLQRQIAAIIERRAAIREEAFAGPAIEPLSGVMATVQRIADTILRQANDVHGQTLGVLETVQETIGPLEGALQETNRLLQELRQDPTRLLEAPREDSLAPLQAAQNETTPLLQDVLTELRRLLQEIDGTARLECCDGETPRPISPQPALPGALESNPQAPLAVCRSFEEGAAASQSFAEAARSVFEDYASAATNAGAQVEGIIGGSLMNMENALVQFVQTGQLNFRALVDSLLADLIRLTIRAAILGPLARALGAAFGPGGGVGVGSNVLSGGNTPFEIGSGNFTINGATGLNFTVPPGFPGDSFFAPLALTSGERVKVTPSNRFRAGEAADGSVVNVTVINQAGAEVETRERPNGRGGVDLELLITRAVARDITRGGPVARSVLGLTGTGPALIGR
jgi:hypothetical protein